MTPPYLFYEIYISFVEQNDCTPPKCGELSEYTDTAHTEVEDLEKIYEWSDVYDRCGHDITSSLNDKKILVTDVSVVKDDKEGRKEGNVSFNDALNTF